MAPTPETSAQAIASVLLFTWGPILRAESSVSGQRIALPPGYSSAPRRAARERPTVRPSPAVSDEPTVLRHPAGHDTGRSAYPARHTRPAIPPRWVGPSPYNIAVATR